MLQPRGLGAIEPPVDTRDYSIGQLDAYVQASSLVLPSVFSLAPMPPLLDQDGTPECEAYSGIGVKGYQEHLQLGRWMYDRRSAELLYAGAKSIDGLPAGTEGTYGRAILQWLQTRGAVAVDGHRYLIGSYYSLLGEADRGRAIEQTLVALRRPVMIAIPFYQSYYDAIDSEGFGGTLPLPKPGEPSIGGHAIWVWRYVTTPSGESAYCTRWAWGLVGINGNIYLQPGHVAQAWELYVAVDR